MTLRRKVFSGYVILLGVFLGAIYPLVEWWIAREIVQLTPSDMAVSSILSLLHKDLLLLIISLLVVFACFAWLIFYQATRPIRRLIRAIDLNAKSMAPINVGDMSPEDDVALLANALNQLSERIRRQISVGKDFIANASHELKTPITIIRGFAETLHDHPELPPEKVQEVTHKIVVNCQRMETLVRNLLTLADVENLPLERLQECNIAIAIDNCVQMLQTLYPLAKIALTYPQELYVIGDQDLLELAIMNLLNNAAKYSKGVAQIAVNAFLENKEVVIVISDCGIGIPKEDQSRIFERFYTVNKAHSRKLGGSGLGLAITRTIIEKHRGKISLQSVLGEGTTFTIRLPASFV